MILHIDIGSFSICGASMCMMRMCFSKYLRGNNTAQHVFFARVCVWYVYIRNQGMQWINMGDDGGWWEMIDQ